MSENKINREYKDRLFVFIFGRNENRKWTLNLYNAVNGSSYTDADAIEINTIEDELDETPIEVPAQESEQKPKRQKQLLKKRLQKRKQLQKKQ